MRLGLEENDLPDWCDSFAPSKWNGMTLESKSNGQCTWGKSLPYQCFGLRAEQLNSDGSRMSSQQCQAACCASSECSHWQQLDDRGCYYGNDEGIWCQEELLKFVGSRKCVPNYCGTKEEEIEILAAYNNRSHSRRRDKKRKHSGKV